MLSYTMLSYTMLSYTMLSYTMLSYTMLSYTTLSYTMLSYTMLSYTMLSYTTLSYTTLSYNTLTRPLPPSNLPVCQTYWTHTYVPSPSLFSLQPTCVPDILNPHVCAPLPLPSLLLPPTYLCARRTEPTPMCPLPLSLSPSPSNLPVCQTYWTHTYVPPLPLPSLLLPPTYLCARRTEPTRMCWQQRRATEQV